MACAAMRQIAGAGRAVREYEIGIGPEGLGTK
jgi:hypothetical protein